MVIFFKYSILTYHLWLPMRICVAIFLRTTQIITCKFVQLLPNEVFQMNKCQMTENQPLWTCVYIHVVCASVVVDGMLVLWWTEC